jgi:F0F1-type ATP synthase assembly protein I
MLSVMNIPADSTGTPQTGWNATVGTAVALQWLVILALAGVAGILGGWKAASSLFMGGAAVAVPNAALALWLTLRVHMTGTLGVIAMLGGELLKLGLTLALLVLVVAGLKKEASWLALIIGVIAALKAQWLALWFTRRY